MTLNLAYKRIARPFQSPVGDYIASSIDQSYLTQPEYAPDRATSIRGYHAIESDLRRLFEYVEPDDRNLSTFSTRIYEILLRAATEFEANCKAILSANNYSGPGHWTMRDYKKIERATRLSDYQLQLSTWADGPKVIRPLLAWSNGGSLPWFSAYNSVKHSRVEDFDKANLKNAVEAVAALFAILFSQFNVLAFSPHELVSSVDNWDGWLSHTNSIFWIKASTSWNPEECYGFGPRPASFIPFGFDQ
jgi:hypothetical protein